MMVTAYLFDYTLNVLCGGNKSECSRRLGIRRTDFNRLQQRFQEGATSIRAVEAILLMFWQEKHSLDQALRGYQCDGEMIESRDENTTHEAAIRKLREEMAREWQQASVRMRIFKEAESLMAQLEHSFCTDDCRMLRDCNMECPCRRFAEYMNWLRDELARSEPKGDE